MKYQIPGNRFVFFILCLFICVFVLKQYFELLFIEPDSIKPRVGILVLNSKSFKKGDYIAFVFPYKDKIGFMGKTLVKKIVCTEGNSLESDGKFFYCNGTFLASSKDRDKKGNKTTMFIYSGRVPAGCFFVLGDNNVTDSYDSRYWGFVRNDWIKGRLLPLINSSGSAWAEDNANNTIIDRLDNLNKGAYKDKFDIKSLIEKNPHMKEAKEKAKKVDAYLKSPEFKSRVAKEKERFENSEVLGQKAFAYDNQSSSTKKAAPAVKFENERLYIFMSSSVPESTWNAYAESLNKINSEDARMILRGCVGGCTYLKPTISFLQNIIAPDPQYPRNVIVDIDPILFKTYGISKVPAIVYARNVNVLSRDISEGLNDNLSGKPVTFTIYGDVSLQYALQRISDKTNSTFIKSLNDILKKNFYSN